jgi:hypothetical protein
MITSSRSFQEPTNNTTYHYYYYWGSYVHTILASLTVFLDRLNQMLVDAKALANLGFQTRRIFNLSKRDRLFKQLTDHNNELRTLLNSSDRIAELRQHHGARKGSAHLKGLWQLRRHAGQLYSLLMQSWRCECKTLHQTNLLLQHRTSSKAEFRIMFVYALQNLKPKPWLWTCQETNIKMLDAEWQPKKPAVSFAPTCNDNDNNIQSISSRVESTSTTGSKKTSFRRLVIEKLKRGRHKYCYYTYVDLVCLANSIKQQCSLYPTD